MTYTEHEQRMLDQQSGLELDRIMQQTARATDWNRVRRIVAEARAWEMVECLKDAVAGKPHWRWHAKQILEAIDCGELPVETDR